MSTTFAPQTYLPAEADSADLDHVHTFFASHASEGTTETRYYLVGEDDGRVELPQPVYRALRLVADALAAGRAVTVAPEATLLTTQQAADLLGVSRPTVVRLVDGGDLACERYGNRRRIRLGDLLSYRERRRSAQYAMLASTTDDLADEASLDEAESRSREVRRTIAEKRRQK